MSRETFQSLRMLLMEKLDLARELTDEEILETCVKAANDLYEETAASNPKFKKIYEQWRKFRDDQLQWFAVAENRFDNFMQAARMASARSKK